MVNAKSRRFCKAKSRRFCGAKCPAVFALLVILTRCFPARKNLGQKQILTLAKIVGGFVATRSG